MKDNNIKTFKSRMAYRLMHIPKPVLAGILTIGSIMTGIVVSGSNLVEPKLLADFSLEYLIQLIILYAAVIGCNFINKLTAKVYKTRVLNDVYIDILSKALDSKMVDIQKKSSGKIFESVKDIARLKGELGVSAISLIPTVLPFIILLVKEWNYDWKIAVISLVSTLLIFGMGLATDRLFGWTKAAKDIKGEMSGITVDNYGNMTTLKYLKQGHFAVNRLKRSQEKSAPYMVNIYEAMWWRLLEVLAYGALIANAYLARHDIELLAFIFLSNWTMENMRSHLTNISEGVIELNAQKDLISHLKGDDKNIPPYLKSGDNIELNGVSFDYGEKTEKFFVDHLEFKHGSRTLVTGESGEGKSSLANLLAGGIKPVTGYVPKYNTYYIWQETEIFDDSLWSNIVFENEEGIFECEVLELFKELNMMEWFLNLKDGFETHVGERGCRLSSGQKQRINIVRLILWMRYHSSCVFIIDEITSNLDSKTRELAIKLIDRECKSTLICISHNEGFDRICDSGIKVENHRFTHFDIIHE